MQVYLDQVESLQGLLVLGLEDRLLLLLVKNLLLEFNLLFPLLGVVGRALRVVVVDLLLDVLDLDLDLLKLVGEVLDVLVHVIILVEGYHDTTTPKQTFLYNS